MKKIILAMIAAIMLATGVSAFSDISDAEQNRAVSSLYSLGIVNGTTSDRFSPDAKLTRAQFCKMAVLSMGDSDFLTYKNYTLFPDVLSSHWASAYINSAVKKHSILRGFPDGYFRPEQEITYAQAVTMMLSMLSYKTEDIGSLWPQDYIAKAEELGLLDGVTVSSANLSATRGDAAVMLRNMLLSKTKDGTLMLSTSFDTVTSDVMLLATNLSDPSIAENYARFYSDETKTLKRTEHDLLSPLIGTSGYLVADSAGTNEVKGFVSDSKKALRASVIRSYPDKLETSEGTFEISSDAKVIASGDIADYGSGWFDLISGAYVNLFYDDAGEITLLSAEASNISGMTFVYGTSGAYSIAQTAKVIKNGLSAKASDIRKYDVVTYSTASGIYYVSDKKLSGVYQKASPSYSYPSSVTVLSKEFTVSKDASAYFKNFSYNQQITLLFDANMNVAAAYPSSQVQVDQIGVLTSLQGSTAKVMLLTGFVIEGEVNLNAFGYTRFNGSNLSNLYKFEGKLIKLSQQSNGTLSITSAVTGSSIPGDWNIGTGKLGEYEVVTGVRVFEQVHTSAPMIEISAADIPRDIVKAKDIRQILKDYAGRITTIVVSDVSGNGYEYGILSGSDETVYLQQNDETLSYYSESMIGISGAPGAVAKGMEDLEYYFELPYKKLVSLGSVGLGDFSGSRGVTVSGGYLEIADNVQVYASGIKRFLTLSEAKANYKNFAIYSDYSADDGGRVRMIVVS